MEKIIHQVWEGREEPTPPVRLKILAESWENKNPSWDYHLWNGDEMDQLVKEYFPQYLTLYNSFPHNVQRWDMIRYMILYIYGGVYADLDTECYKSLDPLFKDKTICFGEEPPEHYPVIGVDYMVGNALMASNKKNDGWLYLISEIEKVSNTTFKNHQVLNTTGPLIITNCKEELQKQFKATILSYKNVSPLCKDDVIDYITGRDTSVFIKKIESAFCAHYFFWFMGKKI